MPKHPERSESKPVGPYLRAPEAALYSGLSVATLAKLRSVGGGPRFFRRGRMVLYTRAQLDEWCQGEGERRSTADQSSQSHK